MVERQEIKLTHTYSRTNGQKEAVTLDYINSKNIGVIIESSIKGSLPLTMIYARNIEVASEIKSLFDPENQIAIKLKHNHYIFCTRTQATDVYKLVSDNFSKDANI